MKISTKLELDKAIIELSKEENKHYLWIFNKTIEEHIGISLNMAELRELRNMLSGDCV